MGRSCAWAQAAEATDHRLIPSLRKSSGGDARLAMLLQHKRREEIERAVDKVKLGGCEDGFLRLLSWRLCQRSWELVYWDGGLCEDNEIVAFHMEKIQISRTHFFVAAVRQKPQPEWQRACQELI
jgi:hypothetical protein